MGVVNHSHSTGDDEFFVVGKLRNELRQNSRITLLVFSFQNDAPHLSPLPVRRRQPASPRRLSSRHEIYVSPIKEGMYLRSLCCGLTLRVNTIVRLFYVGLPL